MPRPCTICQHPDRALIDDALLAGVSNRRIATQYGLTEASLRRHVAAGHIPKYLAKAHEAAEVVQADSLLTRLRELNTETREILTGAREAKDNELALKAIARVEKQLELEAKLLGELQEGTTINVYTSPQWLELRAVIVKAIAPYPQAVEAVLEAIDGAG